LLKYLIGTYFYKSYKLSTERRTYIHKIVDITKGKDGERFLVSIDLKNQKIARLSIDSLRDWSMGIAVPKDGVDFVSCGNTTVFIKDHYFHRVGGPAYTNDHEEKSYYLFGKELSKEEYLEIMPEDIQTKLCFEINEM
jgi:hypothetical protein